MYAQQVAALREAGRAVVVPPGPAPKVFKEWARPIPTSAPGPKLYDNGLYFPRGDVSAGSKTRCAWITHPLPIKLPRR